MRQKYAVARICWASNKYLITDESMVNYGSLDETYKKKSSDGGNQICASFDKCYHVHLPKRLRHIQCSIPLIFFIIIFGQVRRITFSFYYFEVELKVGVCLINYAFWFKFFFFKKLI